MHGSDGLLHKLLFILLLLVDIDYCIHPTYRGHQGKENMRTDNPLKDLREHEADAERWLESRPKCRICGEHIQDNVAFFYDPIGYICDECLIEYRRFIDE